MWNGSTSPHIFTTTTDSVISATLRRHRDAAAPRQAMRAGKYEVKVELKTNVIIKKVQWCEKACRVFFFGVMLFLISDFNSF